LYQRLLLPLDVERVRDERRVDRVLLLDSYVPIVRPQRGVRYAALVHDVLPLTRPEFWPRGKRLVKRTAFATLRHAKPTMFASTEYNAAQIPELLSAPVKVVRFGCGQLHDSEADEAHESSLPEHAPYLLYIGALERRKNVLSLVSVLGEVTSSLRDDLSLVVVVDGHPAYVRSLRAAIDGAGCQERIQLVPRATRDDAIRLLRHASALLLPSLAEGFGLPILEALALGAPVVASDIPEIRSWASDTILYASPVKPADWVAPIESAIKSGVSRRRTGQMFDQQYRWRYCAGDVLGF